MRQSIISKEKVETLLPQKSPFVMVKDLFEFEADRILTGFFIASDHIFVEKGYLNESGMIENVAQSVALHTSYDYFLKNEKSPVGYIGSISKVKIFGYPKRNQNIRTEVKIITEFMGVTLVEGEIFLEDDLLLSLRMKTFIKKEVI